MSVAVIALLWLALAISLAANGRRRLWLAALLAFPLVCAAVYVTEPSFHAAGARPYVTVAAAMAALVWAVGAMVSAVAWFVSKRRGRATSDERAS